MEIKRNDRSRVVRSTAIFVAAAFVLQLIFVVLLTPQGLSRAYPFVLKNRSERVISDASFAEYFHVREEFSDGELFLLGADTGVSESYFVIMDYLRFLKKTYDVSVLALPIPKKTAEYVSTYINATEETKAEDAKNSMRRFGVRSNEFYAFVEELRELNATLSPKRKLSVTGVHVETVSGDIISRFSVRVIEKWGNADEAIIKAMSISDPDEFFDYFEKNIDSFKNFLDEDEFSKYENAMVLHRRGEYDAWKLSLKLAEMPDVKTLLVLDPRFLDSDSPMRSYLDDLGKKYYPVQIKYHSCRSATLSRVADLHEIHLPFVSDTQVRFVSQRSVSSFLENYRFVSNPSDDENRRELSNALEALSTPNFFIVSNSSEVSFSNGGTQ